MIYEKSFVTFSHHNDEIAERKFFELNYKLLYSFSKTKNKNYIMRGCFIFIIYF